MRFLLDITSILWYGMFIDSKSHEKWTGIMKMKVATWIERHTETLKSLFIDFCGDTGTEATDDNYKKFAVGMYSQCRH